MVEYKIKWNKTANESLVQVLDFYIIQNGNNHYSSKLFDLIINGVNNLKKFPKAGKQTGYFDILELVLDRNSVFYRIDSDLIIILLVWDNRQNPEKLIFLLK